MFKILLRLKHWQLFVLAILWVVVPFTFLLTLWRNAAASWVLMFIMLLFPVCLYVCFYLIWFYTLAVNAHKKLPETVKMNLTRFKIIFFIPVGFFVFMGFWLFGFTGFLDIDLLEAGVSILEGVFPLISISCFVYCLYFNAKSFRAAELQRPVTFSDFAGEFFLIGLFPLGVWFIQPRINRMFYKRLSIKKMVGITILLVIAAITGYIYVWSYVPSWKVEDFKKQTGAYILDLKNSDLKGYEKDSALYKNLTITFRADGTFILNRDVPFIYDSSGIWQADSWESDDAICSEMYYHKNLAADKKDGYSQRFSIVGLHYHKTIPAYKDEGPNSIDTKKDTMLKDIDSSFSMGDVRHKEGKEGVNILTFKKIKK